MSVKIDFFQGMSGDYYVNPNQSFTREEAVFITKAINEALKKLQQQKQKQKYKDDFTEVLKWQLQLQEKKSKNNTLTGKSTSLMISKKQ